jgi:hypothetical protein
MRLLKSRPKCSPNHFLPNITVVKSIPQNMFFCNLQKNTQSKRSSKRRKFAQSGHPGSNPFITCYRPSSVKMAEKQRTTYLVLQEKKYSFKIYSHTQSVHKCKCSGLSIGSRDGINWRSGLPDGFFSNQKYKFGQILEGLRWENVDIGI